MLTFWNSLPLFLSSKNIGLHSNWGTPEMHDGRRHKNKAVSRMTCRNGFWERFLFLHCFENGASSSGACIRCAHQALVANVSGGSCSTWKVVLIDRGDVEQKAPSARHIKNEFSLGFKGLRCKGRERWELVTLLVCLGSPSSSESQLIHPSAFKPTEVSDCLKALPATLSRGLTIQYWLLPKIITLHWW